MEVGTEKCLLSRVCPKLTAYELTKEVPLDWQLIKINCQINQSYNPLLTVLCTFNQYLNNEIV